MQGVLAAVLWLPAAAPASPVWLPVTHTTRARGHAYPEVVKTEAEQAHLHFECRGATYDVPDTFVDDLLWLGADSSVRASMSARDVVFTMIGSSGERGYTVHFDFRAGRFFQRILDYGDARTILIRTASDAAAGPR